MWRRAEKKSFFTLQLLNLVNERADQQTSADDDVAAAKSLGISENTGTLYEIVTAVNGPNRLVSR